MMEEIKAFHKTLEGLPVLDSKNASVSIMYITVCKDQEGSRFIQNCIDKWTSDDEIKCCRKVCK